MGKSKGLKIKTKRKTRIKTLFFLFNELFSFEKRTIILPKQIRKNVLRTTFKFGHKASAAFRSRKNNLPEMQRIPAEQKRPKPFREHNRRNF